MWKRVIKWKHMPFHMKIISPPSWISLLTIAEAISSSLLWEVCRRIFQTVANFRISWNLNPTIPLAFMCPILDILTTIIPGDSLRLPVEKRIFVIFSMLKKKHGWRSNWSSKIKTHEEQVNTLLTTIVARRLPVCTDTRINMDPSVSLCVRIERVQKECETTFKNISLFFLLGCIKVITRLQALCI